MARSKHNTVHLDGIGYVQSDKTSLVARMGGMPKVTGVRAGVSYPTHGKRGIRVKGYDSGCHRFTIACYSPKGGQDFYVSCSEKDSSAVQNALLTLSKEYAT